MNIKSYIGDKKFYRSTLAIAVPIMIQNGITNFVNMLDNIMVGRLGTEAMSGVSIVNQFIFVFNLLIFGAVSAAGIFTAQFHGNGDNEGVKHTFRFKFLINTVCALLGIAVFFFFDDALINLFLHESEGVGDLALTLSHGKSYLLIMLIGLIPYSISQVYASTLRETGETVIPMISSIAAMLTNCVLNLLLIFGLLGFPALGVSGAAIATVISRFVELAVLTVYTHTHKEKCLYIVGVYRSIKIPSALFGKIAVKGLPLMLNEFFWSLALTLRNQCYSTRGLDVVAAQNISTTIFNVLNVVYMSLGFAVAVIVGNLLGAGKIDEAKQTDKKLITFSVFSGCLISLIFVILSFIFPYVYNTTDTVRTLASFMMLISAINMPFAAYANSAYFTLRSGGKVMITLLFDSVYMWVIVMPISFILSYLTGVGIHLLFAICQLSEIFKAIFGWILLRRGTWARRLVGESDSDMTLTQSATAD